MNPRTFPRFVPPDELTATQRTTLVRVRRERLERTFNGWKARGNNRRVAITTAAALERLDLVAEERKDGRHYLTLTPLGSATCDAIENRARAMSRRRERA